MSVIQNECDTMSVSLNYMNTLSFLVTNSRGKTVNSLPHLFIHFIFIYSILYYWLLNFVRLNSQE